MSCPKHLFRSLICIIAEQFIRTFIFLHWKSFLDIAYKPMFSFSLLSGHILCKESIAIVKKFDCEILTYLYVLRPPDFIYAIFEAMYVCVCVSVCVCVCVCVCVRVCVYVIEHDSV